MASGPATVEQWKRQNALRLIECKWGCMITPEACRAYQSRTNRYILRLNGERNRKPRVNADYLRCLRPEPCAHILSDSDAEALRAQRDFFADEAAIERRNRAHQIREHEKLTSPDQMLAEPEWNRSLVKR